MQSACCLQILTDGGLLRDMTFSHKAGRSHCRCSQWRDRRQLVMNAGRIEQQGEPRELYERPATPFLVRFMGESNPLRGMVRRLDAGARAHTAGRCRYRCRRCNRRGWRRHDRRPARSDYRRYRRRAPTARSPAPSPRQATSAPTWNIPSTRPPVRCSPPVPGSSGHWQRERPSRSRWQHAA